MTNIRILQAAFKQVYQYKKVVFLLYISVVALAVFAAYPFQQYWSSKVGHSLMLSDMIKGFDYTLINDFNNTYGMGLSPILQQSSILLIVFALVLVFFMGGILALFKQQGNNYDGNLFWSASATYFWRMFRLTFIFAIIHAFVFWLFIQLYLSLTQGMSPNNLMTDTVLFSTFYMLLFLYLLVGAFFFMWHDYAKVQLVKNDNRWVVKSIFLSLGFTLKNPFKTYSLYLLNMLLLVLLFALNYGISHFLVVASGTTILLSLLLSQVLVLARLYVKLLNLSSIFMVVNNTIK